MGHSSAKIAHVARVLIAADFSIAAAMSEVVMGSAAQNDPRPAFRLVTPGLYPPPPFEPNRPARNTGRASNPGTAWSVPSSARVGASRCRTKNSGHNANGKVTATRNGSE